MEISAINESRWNILMSVSPLSGVKNNFRSQKRSLFTEMPIIYRNENFMEKYLLDIV